MNAVRVPFADASCLRLPGEPGDDWEHDFVLLADAFPTGYHATELAQVSPGDSVAIFGAGCLSSVRSARGRLHQSHPRSRRGVSIMRPITPGTRGWYCSGRSRAVWMRSAHWQKHYVDDIGFTVIVLFAGFVIIVPST